MKLMGSLLT